MQRERKYKDERLNEAVKELRLIRRQQRDIDYLQSKLEEYRDSYSCISAIHCEEVRVQGGPVCDKLVETAIKWAELEAKINNLKYEKERKLWLIWNKLEQLTVMQARVIELYYIKGYTIIKVAQILGYEEVSVRKIKQSALKKYSEF